MGNTLEQQKVATCCYSVQFVRKLEYGTCVGVGMRKAEAAEPWPIPDAGLTETERSRAADLRGQRRPSYIAGRLALRQAVHKLGIRADTIGSTERGAPIVPQGVVGSISHKQALAIAIAAPDEGWTLGVDIEAHKRLTRDISRRVLTQAEIDELDRERLSGYQRTLAVLLRFSIKEAVYKAIDPFVTRFVGFREVSVHPRADGQVVVRAQLSPAPTTPLDIRARYITYETYFISCARARPVR